MTGIQEEYRYREYMEGVRTKAQCAVDEIVIAANSTQVAGIQEEYHQYMEQVWAKAQRAIDEVNQTFEAKGALWSDVFQGDIMEMDKQFFNALQHPAAGEHVGPCSPESM